MSESLKDILSNLNPDTDPETLLLYLQGKLTATQQHELEKGVMKDDFDTDALDGLQNFKDKRKITELVAQLNRDLKKKTEKKKKFRQKLELKLAPSLLITIIIVMLLVVVSYFVIHKFLHH